MRHKTPMAVIFRSSDLLDSIVFADKLKIPVLFLVVIFNFG